MRLPFLVALVCATLPACMSTEVQSGVAAVRTNADDAASQRELENVISTALDGRPISLADDALSADSQLIIERSAAQQRVLGRDLGKPEHFDLVLDANQCFLVHRRTALRWLLNDTECRAK